MEGLVHNDRRQKIITLSRDEKAVNQFYQVYRFPVNSHQMALNESVITHWACSVHSDEEVKLCDLFVSEQRG